MCVEGNVLPEDRDSGPGADFLEINDPLHPGEVGRKLQAKAGKVKYRNKSAVKNLVTTGRTVKLYAMWK